MTFLPSTYFTSFPEFSEKYAFLETQNNVSSQFFSHKSNHFILRVCQFHHLVQRRPTFKQFSKLAI